MGPALRIPKQFSVAGHIIRVRYKPMRDDDGRYEDSTKTIWLHSELKKGPPSHHFQVFAHELNHALFAHVGRDDLFEDETLVDTLAHIMVPAIEAIVVANRQRKT